MEKIKNVKYKWQNTIILHFFYKTFGSLNYFLYLCIRFQKQISLTIKNQSIMKQEMINEIGKYLRENVEDFDVRVNLALKTMDRKRCSFDFADCDLHNECYDKIEEWYEENGIEPEYIDVEEIIFEMD
jgi:hypothetical protein